MVTRLDGLNGLAEDNILGFEVLQRGVQADKAVTEDLLAKGKAAQKVRA